jgi:hypothetical protein
MISFRYQLDDFEILSLSSVAPRVADNGKRIFDGAP